ncbi:patatin-like phospholipase family protein [Thermocrinis minervae]|uniref:NTE family protein n=1 Tax=Thermocrinis minervae TaxID=381751 RepID=A0A1M6SPP0_9AQUI|nr:patatin-like phospholipase family protein [Thermocrinis minervae]SHK46711.1 NTE family protein [Thermocrinis minervae]
MKVNLVLSGGAARGIAHIGVLQALEDLRVEVISVSGVSAGALVGAFYCAGYTPKQMLKLIKETRLWEWIRPRIPPKLGLFSLQRAKFLLKKYLPERLESLKIPLFVCALDIKTGRTLYFREGELYSVVLGSCALPGVFEPVKHFEYMLVDGGVTNNLPVEPFQESEIPTLCVDVNPYDVNGEPRNILHLLLRSFFLAVRSNVDKRKEFCTYLIEPDLRGYSLVSLRKADELFRLGYVQTMRILRAV